MTQVTAKELNPLDEPDLASSIQQGLIIGGGLVGGMIIIVLVVICCCCNVRTQRADNVKIVKSTNRPSDVKNTVATPKISPDPAQNQPTSQDETKGGEERDLNCEMPNNPQGKIIRFSRDDKRDHVNTCISKTITSLPTSTSGITLPSYAKVQGSKASAFYLNATIQ